LWWVCALRRSVDSNDFNSRGSTARPSVCGNGPWCAHRCRTAWLSLRRVPISLPYLPSIFFFACG
jgi:hypothetical protein